MNLSPEFDSRFRKRKRRWNRFVAWLSAVVVFITTYMLILPALTAETKLNCELQEHTHTDACWAEQLEPELVGATCIAPHTHTASCRDAEGNLVCGYADFYLHTHDENCYNSAGELVCPLPEVREHTHTDGCYAADGSLCCGKVAAKEHTHSSGCYEGGKLVCGMLEVHVHRHDESCLQFEDVPRKVLICGEVEHTHDETCLLSRQAAPEAEPYEHTHTEECYKDGALICTLAEQTADNAAAETNSDDTVAPLSENDVPDVTPTADGEAASDPMAQRGSEQNPYTVEDYAEAISVVYPEGIEALLQSEEPFAENDAISFTLTINNSGIFAEDSWFRYALPFDWAAFDGASLTTEAESNTILVRDAEIGEWRLEDNAILCYFNEAADEYSAVSIEIPLTIRSALAAVSPKPLMSSLPLDRDGSEESPFIIEDYGGESIITVEYPIGILERLQSTDPFADGPTITFSVKITNKSPFMNDSWFAYEIPLNWEAFADAQLASRASSNLITFYDSTLGETCVLGEWKVRDHCILCHFNNIAEDHDNVSMEFAMVIIAGEEEEEEQHFDANNPLVRIEKLDASTNEPLEGVVFAVFDENGNELVRSATDENGIVTFQVTDSGGYLSFYNGFYFTEIYDETSPAYLADYIKDTRERWFVSTPDEIPPVFRARIEKLKEEHPDIVQITRSDRDRYVLGEQSWIVYNSPYFHLPETGGEGLAWLISLGAALLTLGFWGLVARRKDRRTCTAA